MTKLMTIMTKPRFDLIDLLAFAAWAGVTATLICGIH